MSRENINNPLETHLRSIRDAVASQNIDDKSSRDIRNIDNQLDKGTKLPPTPKVIEDKFGESGMPKIAFKDDAASFSSNKALDNTRSSLDPFAKINDSYGLSQNKSSVLDGLEIGEAATAVQANKEERSGDNPFSVVDSGVYNADGEASHTDFYAQGDDKVEQLTQKDDIRRALEISLDNDSDFGFA